MNKHNNFVIFLKKINLLINSLLKKYLNKLNFNNLSDIARSNKFFLTFVAFIILFLSYLSIPHIYDKAEMRKQLENQLLDKFSLNFTFSKKFNYKFYPRPHFIIEDAYIFKNQSEISYIKKLIIFVSLDNLFSLNNISINNVILENANFNLNKENFNFFTKLLDSNFSESSLNIINSNIFFRNIMDEVLFINKIVNMKYHYDSKELKNIVVSKNKIFNIPYSINLYTDKIKNKIFSKIRLNFLKLQIENEINYGVGKKNGLINLLYNKNKSEVHYKWNKNFFNFNFTDKLIDPNFNYEGEINFNPFYGIFKGNTNKIDLSDFFNSDSLIVQILKTEILNNKNLNIDLSIDAKKIANHINFTNAILNFKIQEGLIDIDKTKFRWKKYADFIFSDSLIYVNKSELILDGKLSVNIKNYDEIYKYLQISKSLRTKLDKLEFNFIYNFDQHILNFNDVKINDQSNKNINDVLKKIVLKKNKLQNKIYLKNLINDVLTAYDG